MADMQIAPSGMIVGTVRGRNPSGAQVRDYNRHAIVLLDGWLHHMAQNIGDPAAPWYRMHDQSIPGFAKSDFPAPLVVNDHRNSDYLLGYDTLVVSDGECRRWRYNQREWMEVDEPPLFKGVIGAPALIRRDDMPFGSALGPSTYDAYLPTRVGLFRLSYFSTYGFWLPRDIVTREITGWPSVIYISGECIVYATVDGVLKAYSKMNDSSLFPNWNESAARAPSIICHGAPSAVTLWPRMGFKGDYPIIELGQVHLVAPSEKGLIHFWTNQEGAFEWNWESLDSRDVSCVSLVSPLPAASEGYDGWQKVSNIEALLIQKRDALQQTWVGETRVWETPSFAF